MKPAVKKALVVDDDVNNLQMVAALLQNRGYIVFTASDGDMGLELLEKEKMIDVIITDIVMPKKEGIGFMRAVRSLYPEIKLIAMTGSANFEKVAETARDFGANEVFKKPFEISVFTESVDRLTGKL